jgi:hypothetical protein
MNAAPRILKSVYRKEPISSFVMIVGAVDAAIGGIGDRWSLVTFGLGTIGVAIALRWWQSQHKQLEPTRQVPKYLPASSSRPQLPPLTSTKKRPPY